MLLTVVKVASAVLTRSYPPDPVPDRLPYVPAEASLPGDTSSHRSPGTFPDRARSATGLDQRSSHQNFKKGLVSGSGEGPCHAYEKYMKRLTGGGGGYLLSIF